MPQSLDHTLSAVMVETLEKLAFLFASPLEEPPAETGAEMPAVRVAFSGPFCGEIELGLSLPVLEELAANMLGADDGSGLSVEERHDALKELANIVCGNLLPAIGGRAVEFNIKSPCIKPQIGWGVPGQGLPHAAAECRLVLENGHCRAALRFEGDPPPFAGGGAHHGKRLKNGWSNDQSAGSG